ncbi:EAL domain-containing protein [Lysobacter sp. N42]|uniref:bifunctional diguanylate cyclase/phosphodiesterase n=2 Tax=Gammaproteobacteria TaxID=1236 RepID=UPI0014053C2D|nr:EAL domain-containing protein [Lysobacter sp. N42]
MAILAAYTSLSHVELIKSITKPWQRLVWHASGSLAMGLGVWAMHFTGMISFQLPFDVFYSPTITAISVIPAIIAAAITLQLLKKEPLQPGTILLGGVLMGAGIGAMHYTGMAAILTHADMRYIPVWFAVSIAVAVLLAVIALATKQAVKPFVRNEYVCNALSAVVMGCAISGMHYTAMHATLFFPTDAIKTPLSGANASQIVTSTLLVAMFIVLTSTVVVLMVRRQHKLERAAAERGEEVAVLTERLQRVANRVPGMVFELHRSKDGFLTFRYLSEAAEQIFGVSPERAMKDAKAILELMTLSERARIIESLTQSAVNLRTWSYEFSVAHKHGSKRWLYATATPFVEVEQGVSFSGFITDITDKKKDEETINRLAFYDSLTGLPNRRFFLRNLSERMAQFAIESQVVVLWAINLDGFKRINDVHGQHQGDALLKACARRLENIRAEDGLLCRLTADEFVMVATFSTEEEAQLAASSIANQTLSKLNTPFDLPRLRHQSSASVGVVLMTDDSISGEEAIRRADLAVHHAKQVGGAQWQYYQESIEEEVSARFELEMDLREALNKDELQLFYQLQVDSEGNTVGAEALMRWFHPARGMVSPGLFIPIAEDSGLIVSLGEWALTQACKQLALWKEKESTAAIRLSVNVSPRQFYQHDFVENVLHNIRVSGIDPTSLKLELTESLVLEDMDVVVDKMRELKAHGVSFSMDDFGTGYSSLSYLSFLPFDEVKIDQAFIRRASSEEFSRDWTIVEAIIGIANNLGMEVIAEGVETQAQCDRLKASGCFRYQGYLFSKPSAVSDLPI